MNRRAFFAAGAGAAALPVAAQDTWAVSPAVMKSLMSSGVWVLNWLRPKIQPSTLSGGPLLALATASETFLDHLTEIGFSRWWDAHFAQWVGQPVDTAALRTTLESAGVTGWTELRWRGLEHYYRNSHPLDKEQSFAATAGAVNLAWQRLYNTYNRIEARQHAAWNGHVPRPRLQLVGASAQDLNDMWALGGAIGAAGTIAVGVESLAAATAITVTSVGTGLVVLGATIGLSVYAASQSTPAQPLEQTPNGPCQDLANPSVCNQCNDLTCIQE